MTRQRTHFDLCNAHRGLESDGRYRLAEIFCEGGPGYGPPCSPQPCRAFPGTDFFNASVTDEDAAQWVRNWAVNTR